MSGVLQVHVQLDSGMPIRTLKFSVLNNGVYHHKWKVAATKLTTTNILNHATLSRATTVKTSSDGTRPRQQTLRTLPGELKRDESESRLARPISSSCCFSAFKISTYFCSSSVRSFAWNTHTHVVNKFMPTTSLIFLSIKVSQIRQTACNNNHDVSTITGFA